MTRYFIPVLSLYILFAFSGCSQKKINYSNIKATKHTSAARHRATLKPYVVKCKRYTPTLVKKGQKQYGVSSWYGPNFHGKLTSNGEVYNMHAHTAAHKTFPMDTIVRVRNLENGKSTVVRINDRGPFVDGRIIDCSYCAGKELGLDKSGIAKVEVTVLGVADKICIPEKYNKPREVYTKPSYNREKVVKYKKVSTPKKYQSSRLLGVQLGAFKKLEGAVIYSRKYKNRYVGYHPIIKKVHDVNGQILYRVWLVGFKDSNELRAFKEKQHRIQERM